MEVHELAPGVKVRYAGHGGTRDGEITSVDRVYRDFYVRWAGTWESVTYSFDEPIREALINLTRLKKDPLYEFFAAVPAGCCPCGIPRRDCKYH